VLHHYPESLFSEKVRLLLGYHGLAWRSVIISNIMPRPLLMPLSGGYRKTPILQVDANVYCDTRVIARALARESGDDSLYRAGFAATRAAEWADTQLFQITVALNFRPEAVGAMFGSITPEQAKAFQEDRAKLSGGAPIVGIPASAAQGALIEALTDLEATLGSSRFICGDNPSIADFSVYHCLWFLRNNSVNASLLAPFRAVGAWMETMESFGHGSVEDMSAEDALALGRDAEPVLPTLTTALPAGLDIGDPVTVTPVDYGRIPVSGVLAGCSAHEIVVAREDAEAGRLMTHFPRSGFDLARA